MQAGASTYLPVDAMQHERLAASGFTIPRSNLIAARFACEGDLNMQALLDSVDAVLQRHSALRSSFDEVDGSFFQRLQPERHAEIHLVHGVPDGTGPAGRDPFYRKFDLQAGSFLRLRVTRPGQQSQHFCIELATDHFIADGFALQVILDDISYYYECKLAGHVEDRSPAAQHFEYARWQRGELTPDRVRRVHDVWASRLRVDRPRKAGLPGKRTADTMWNAPEITRSFRTDLPAHWAGRLREWARSAHVTEFMAAAAAYGLSLAKAEGSDDITFLTPMSGRSQSSHRGLVGNLARTLPIRLTCNPDEAGSLAEWAAKVRQEVAFALKYQDLPVSMIAAELEKRQGQYADCPNASFFALNKGFRFSLAGINARELDIDSISEAMLPHSTEIRLSDAAVFIDTIYDPSRASLNTVKLLHAGIASISFDFGYRGAESNSLKEILNGDSRQDRRGDRLGCRDCLGSRIYPGNARRPRCHRGH